jgi:AcrR family transcriptional regulator
MNIEGVKAFIFLMLFHASLKGLCNSWHMLFTAFHMSEKEKKQRKPRRNNVVLENDIMQATKSLIDEVGFSNVTLTGIMQRAEVEPQVFYKRFGELNILIEKFLAKYEYWISDILENYDDKNFEAEYYFRRFITEIAQSFAKNHTLQRLIAWEINEDNPTTRHKAKLRALNTEPVFEKFDKVFKNTPINIRAVTAILVGGIYYSILRSKRSLMCGINFNSRKGREELNNAVDFYVTAILNELNPDARVLEIARKMKEAGIDPETIKECTGVEIGK